MIYVAITAAIIAVLYIILLIMYSKVFVNKDKYADYMTMPPQKKQYARYAEAVKSEYFEAAAKKFEGVFVKSYDGKKLYARFYRSDDSAPTVVLIHGYKSTGLRDLCFALNLLCKLSYNVLLIDLRGHGLSDGKTLSMGVKESRDIEKWTEFLKKRGARKIILYGISMGAATALMSLKRVKVDGVVADCPFDSPFSAFEYTAKKHNASMFRVYMLGVAAAIIGGFSIKKASSAAAVAASDTPVLLISGKNDSVVSPSEKDKIACRAAHCSVAVFDAGHAVSFYSDPIRYAREVTQFLCEICHERK